jgi:hypothetical protein
MILVLEIGLAIYGIVALIKGRFSVSKTKAVSGLPARLLGLVCLTPLPLAVVAIMVYTAASTDVTNPQQVEQWVQNNKMSITLVEAGVVIGVTILIFVVAALLAKPIEEVERAARRPVREYDDEDVDERPRSRRARGEDDEDQPRRRRGVYDDEDDRPRRRRDDD